ncbi:MAG: hypothetical protein H6742_22185 [Alphaproteobacteria bacterium]|nr:hypothetical protein [Alphaproteobacteria bacterium]
MSTVQGSAHGGGPGALPGRLALDQPGVEAAKAERARRRAVADHARELAVQLDALGRTLTFHEASNAAVRHVLARVEESLAGLRATGPGGLPEERVALVFAEGHAFANGVWLRATRRSWDATSRFTEQLAGLRARGVVLDLPRLTADSLLGVARILRVYRDFDPEAVRPLGGVRLIPLPADAGRLRDAAARRRVEALELFEEGLAVCDPERLASLDLYVRRRQRALVLGMVQMAEEGTEELLSLTALREPALTDAAHDLVVAILSVCIGRAMDLSRRDLLRLGVSAISHNVGEAFLPEELRKVPRSLAPTERDRLETHPLRGTRYLLQTYGFAAGTVDRALVSAEHHRHNDGVGGYPAGPGQPHLFARIVSVADRFAALASHRAHRAALPPDQAIKKLLRGSGPELDPLLVRSFVRVVGRFPPGSCVELDTGEVAVVLAPGQGRFPLARPKVLLVRDEDGLPLDTPIEVDLGDRHPRRRAWLRTIARTRDPGRLSLDVANLVFGDRAQVAPTHLDTTVMAT